MFNSISASGYQIVAAAGQVMPKSNVKVATLQGRLSGMGSEEKMPTVALVAHYDSNGVAPVNFETKNIFEMKHYFSCITYKLNEFIFANVIILTF